MPDGAAVPSFAKSEEERLSVPFAIPPIRSATSRFLEFLRPAGSLLRLPSGSRETLDFPNGQLISFLR